MLRLPEGVDADPGDLDVDVPDDETMILNLGPSHPSTHGVLRVMLELDGETILRCKPVVGYLHTGMEKTGEELMYHQGSTNVTRMDYLAPFFNELTFSLGVERLLGIDVPPRATWIRMLMCELNRVSSHMLWLATNGADLGALNLLVYGWREREVVLWFFEKVTGLRMNHNYIRPGGVAADLPDGWRDDVIALCEAMTKRMDDYDRLLTGQPILQQRTEGVGAIDAETAIGLGLTGPLLRSTGVAWDLRRDQPYLAYDQVDFDVIVGSYGDCWDRFAIRANELRESLKICRQIADAMPPGDFRSQDKKVTPPPRDRIDESMEALIHHFKLYTERVPGRAGRRLRTGGVAPRRAGLLPGLGRFGPSLPAPHAHAELQQPAGTGADDARLHGRRFRRHHLHRRPGPRRRRPVSVRHLDRCGPRSRGCADVARLTPQNERRARELIALYPVRRSALIPILHLLQEQDGYLTEDGMVHVGELLGLTAAEVRGTATFYDMLHTEPVGTLCGRRVHQHRLHAGRAPTSCWSTPRNDSVWPRGARAATGCSPWRTPSAWRCAATPRA